MKMFIAFAALVAVAVAGKLPGHMDSAGDGYQYPIPAASEAEASGYQYPVPQASNTYLTPTMAESRVENSYIAPQESRQVQNSHQAPQETRQIESRYLAPEAGHVENSNLEPESNNNQHHHHQH